MMITQYALSYFVGLFKYKVSQKTRPGDLVVPEPYGRKIYQI